MSKIIESTETEIIDYHELLLECSNIQSQDIPSVISHSVVDAADMLKAKAIVASTISGYTARKISSYRPCCPIIATTPEKEAATSLSLNWGVYPVIVDMFKSTDEIVTNAIDISKEKLELVKEDKIVITGGFPSKKTKYTNFMKIEEIE
jgi:pyruvate kinase